MTMFKVLSSWQCTVRVHLVHPTNVARAPCYIHHRHLSLRLSPEAYSHFTIVLRVEVESTSVAGYVSRIRDGLPAGRQSPSQVLTGPSTE